MQTKEVNLKRTADSGEFFLTFINLHVEKNRTFLNVPFIVYAAL